MSTTQTSTEAPPAAEATEASRSRGAAILGRHPMGMVLAAPYAVFLVLVFA